MAFSRGRLATNLPLLPHRLQLPIPVGVDLLLTPGEHVLRRDVADRTVQADVVVMLDIAPHQTPRIFQRQRGAESSTPLRRRISTTFAEGRSWPRDEVG